MVVSQKGTLNITFFSGTQAERITLYRAVRGTERAKRFYALPDPAKEDVEFELVDVERVMIGEPFAVTVNIKNKSTAVRNIQAILSAGSVFYNGVKANMVKRADGDFAVQPGASKSIVSIFDSHLRVQLSRGENNSRFH